MKGQMTILAILTTIITLLVFLAITPVLKEILAVYWDNFTSIEKFLIGLLIPFMLIGILSIVILYSRPYYYER